MAWDGFHFPDPAYYQWGIERLCNDRELLHTLLKRVVSLSGLRLSANASLLLSHRDSITRLNYPEFFKAQLAFYTPASKIGFLQFYQLATSTASPRSVMESFTKLDDALKRLLVSMLWNEFHRDADYCRWGEAHLFDDMQSFRHFLMRFVNERQVCDLPGETILERIDSIDFELPEPHPQQAPAPPPPPVQANWGTARLSGRLLPGCLLQ